MRVLGGPALRQLHHVNVPPRPTTPVKRHGPRDAAAEAVLDDRLDRPEPSAARKKDDRLLALLAQEERPERPLEAQDLALLQRAEDAVREQPARRVPDVQLDVRDALRRRRRRDRVAPALAVRQ